MNKQAQTNQNLQKKIQRYNKLAKQVNDRLDYLYRTNPEAAAKAETAIARANKSYNITKISPKTGKMQVTRATRKFDVAALDKAIERVVKIKESAYTSLRGQKRIEAKRKNAFENIVAGATNKKNVKLTNEQYQRMTEALNKAKAMKIESGTVFDFEREIDTKKFDNEEDYFNALEKWATGSTPIVSETQLSSIPDNELIILNGEYYIKDGNNLEKV